MVTTFAKYSLLKILTLQWKSVEQAAPGQDFPDTTHELRLSHRHHLKMLSQLESAMDNIIKVFYKYSGKEGDKYTLTKAELKDLLKGELEAFLKYQKDPNSVDNIMKDLDMNRDGQVDFQEFVHLVTALTVACNDFFVEFLKKQGKLC
ncbi:protein S100-A1-like isoform X2 [Hemiscyllium ocellatum]|uniref:protein S100-A1-like isoform X2 n=1 Tax=Hemiscyllium ocellatum TaxID=170820 RepID=UPI00296726F3|nr:protein S100-A1-like isoform X2 [Hemiscyllium ocellatum]